MSRAIYPAALHLTGRACLLVGDGEELENRTRNLLASGAKLRVVTEAPSPALQELADAGRINLQVRAFLESDFEGQWLALLVGRNAELAEQMARSAERSLTFFCAIDLPEHSSFSHMALASSGALTIAISTGGAAPSLGRRLREEIARLLREADMERFVERLSELRRRTRSEDRRKVLGDAVRDLRFTGKLELPTKD